MICHMSSTSESRTKTTTPWIPPICVVWVCTNKQDNMIKQAQDKDNFQPVYAKHVGQGVHLVVAVDNGVVIPVKGTLTIDKPTMDHPAQPVSL